MKTAIKFLSLAMVSLLCATIGGCGYHVGSIMHPQIKSIAIAPVVNDTLEPNVSAYMRQALSEQFQLDGSLKVESLSKADCILYCKVTEVKNTSTDLRDSTNGDLTYRPMEWAISVDANFTVMIPGRTAPLISAREVNGSASYQVMADHDIARRRGLQQACRDMAETMVDYTTEAW
jgi:hypothetical protein